MSLRRRLRVGIDHAARGLGVLRRYERRMRGGLTLLTYHRVLPAAECAGYPFPSLVMPAEHFEAQVEWIAAHARAVTVSEGLAEPTSAVGAARVALTFDDGYRDNARVVAPILERHGIRGTFFVTSDFVERGAPMWFDRGAALVGAADGAQLAAAAAESGGNLPELQWDERVRSVIEALKDWEGARRAAFLDALEARLGSVAPLERFAPMTSDEVRALARAGHEVGSHSRSHPILTHVDDGQLVEELAVSRERLETWTGGAVRGFCYPNGTHDGRVVEAVRRAGYAYACTTEAPGPEPARDVLRLPRHDVTPDRVSRPSGRFDLVAYRAEISGLHARLR